MVYVPSVEVEIVMFAPCWKLMVEVVRNETPFARNVTPLPAPQAEPVEVTFPSERTFKHLVLPPWR